MRGKLDARIDHIADPRITPAGAGKTSLDEFSQQSSAGSPPQVRGKHSFAVTSNGEIGITPAGAGKTKVSAFQPNHSWDHPRRCGENSCHSFFKKPVLGSPPQVRGKRCQTLTVTATRRITPAGAGKTFRFSRHSKDCRDHPRRCGENALTLGTDPEVYGSPPQVRGKHVHGFPRSRLSGITPAGAGKTGFCTCGAACTGDHPRRCGENAKQRERIQGDLGSPPQVRGKPQCKSVRSVAGRITPAGAGKT